tara:strand:- start:88 stop:621 length:534 start_codon:yes stop_codon:yes gene_type:complete
MAIATLADNIPRMFKIVRRKPRTKLTIALIVGLMTNAWIAPGYAGSKVLPDPAPIGKTAAGRATQASEPSAGMPPYPVLMPRKQSGPVAKAPPTVDDLRIRQRRVPAGSAAGASAFPARPDAGGTGLVVTATTIAAVVVLGAVIMIAASDSSSSSAGSESESESSSSAAVSATTATE